MDFPAWWGRSAAAGPRAFPPFQAMAMVPNLTRIKAEPGAGR
jgi:hypothetical protein